MLFGSTPIVYAMWSWPWSRCLFKRMLRQPLLQESEKKTNRFIDREGADERSKGKNTHFRQLTYRNVQCIDKWTAEVRLSERRLVPLVCLIADQGGHHVYFNWCME